MLTLPAFLAQDSGSSVMIFLTLLTFFVLGFIAWFISRYRMCPPDRILVVYGKVGEGQSSKCYHGGAAFVWPVMQNYSYLDLTPINIDVPLKGALSSQNIRVDVPSAFIVAVSTEPGIMDNAATRLLGRDADEVRALATEIIMGQMRVVIAGMTIEEINANREKLIQGISNGVEVELHKVGLKLINANITDIRDASGYIEALGKEAASRAVNEALVKVAEETKRGEIGKADAQRDQAIRVAEAQASAIAGENEAKKKVAESNADLQVKQAEMTRRAEVAAKVQAAQALQEAYVAEKEAELTRANREKASQEADILVKADIDKRRREIEAEANAEVQRRNQKGSADSFVIQKKGEAEGIAAVAKGEADAIIVKKKAEGDGIAFVGQGEAAGTQAKLLAEAQGIRAILESKAEGFQRLVGAAGNPDAANRLLITEQLTKIVEFQTGAVKNLKFDKVVVMGGGKDGGSVGGFVQNLVKDTLPLHEMGKSVGLDLPKILGTYEGGASKDDAPKA